MVFKIIPIATCVNCARSFRPEVETVVVCPICLGDYARTGKAPGVGGPVSCKIPLAPKPKEEKPVVLPDFGWVHLTRTVLRPRRVVYS